MGAHHQRGGDAEEEQRTAAHPARAARGRAGQQQLAVLCAVSRFLVGELQRCVRRGFDRTMHLSHRPGVLDRRSSTLVAVAWGAGMTPGERLRLGNGQHRQVAKDFALHRHDG